MQTQHKTFFYSAVIFLCFVSGIETNTASDLMIDLELIILSGMFSYTLQVKLFAAISVKFGKTNATCAAAVICNLYYFLGLQICK